MKTVLCSMLALVMIASCAPVQEVKKDTADAVMAVEELPRTVAIIPFQNDTKDIGIASQVRRSFANNFSSKNYRDIKLPVVDEKIVHLEKASGKNILDIPPQEICQALGCDGLIYGKITDYQKVYAGVYSQLGVEAEVWMVNTKTGRDIFRLKDSVRYHEGGVPMSPIGVIMTAVSTAMNLREIQQVRMVNELCYKFNEKIPSPKGMAVEDRPLIKEVLTNIKEGPFGKARVIRVGLEGEPGLVATFDIGNFKKGTIMKETKPGIYMGEYMVMPGDNSQDMPVIASLKRPGGYESQWIDVSGFVTIDTTPPPQIKGLRAKGFQDRVEVSWEGVKGVSDLAGYKVLRSEQPLSGYVELSKTEQALFEDRTAKPGTVNYYRVVAYDMTGNESEMIDPARASIMSKEPVVLSGEFKKDTVLSGVYIAKGDVILPKGLSLTIEPETRIMFDDNASLTISGRLIVNAKESPVEFVHSADRKWKGIVIEGGSVALNGFRVKGALAALAIRNSEGTIENGTVSGCDTGVSISGVPSVTLKGSTISGNKTGMELIKTDAKIIGNNIFQNNDGISGRDFSGEIKDNNIFDNTKNISSVPAIKLAPNYLGTLNTEEMKLSGANVTKVYDNRVPDGKIVDAITNPYITMTQEERQKKVTELLIEAGNYFRQSNYGKASSLFEEALKASPSAETYYYLALCHRQMKEEDKALKYLKEGSEKFPKDSTLLKNLGLAYYEKGNEAEAKKAFEEVMRLSPEDRQVKFMLERMRK